MIGGDAVEAVSVKDEVVLAVFTGVDVFADDMEPAEVKGENLGEEVVVVASDVDELAAFFVHFFEKKTNEARVLMRPFAPSIQSPHVDNVADKDDLFAMCSLQESD